MRDHANQVLLNELIQRALATYGIETCIFEGWIGPDSGGPAIQGRSNVQMHADEALTVRLEVQVAVPDGRLITERFGAAGDDVASATRSAFEEFSAKSLDFIVAAFFDDARDGKVFRDEWVLGGDAWRVTASPPAVEAWPADGSDDPVIVPPPARLVPEIRRLIERRSVDGHDLHWVQVFFAHQGKNRVAGEVSWDGVPWPQAREALAGLSWPNHDGFHSVRSIAVLQRVAARTSPAEDIRAVAAAVRMTADLLGSRPRADDIEPIHEMMAMGIDEAAAKRLFTFVPLGFAHFLFKDLPLPTESTVLNPNGTTQTVPLAHEPVFLAARQLAAEVSEDSKARFHAIVRRSPLFTAVTRRLEQGNDFEGLAPLFVDLGRTVGPQDESPTYVPPPSQSLASDLAKALEWMPDGSSIDLTGPLPAPSPPAEPRTGPMAVPPVVERLPSIDLTGGLRPHGRIPRSGPANVPKTNPLGVPLQPPIPSRIHVSAKKKGWWRFW